MSIEQLAIDTKIPRASIEALEEDRFGALPGPVFVKGFFRCCARSLELDPETVLSLLHEHERALQQLKSGGRRERQAPQLLGRAAFRADARPEPARPSRPSPGPSASQASAAVPTPAATSGNAAVAGPVTAPASLFNFDAALPWLRSTFVNAANSRLLMWIAIGLMIAVIVMTAFVMVGGPAPTPRS